MKSGYFGMSCCHAVVFVAMISSNHTNDERAKMVLGFVVMVFQVLSVLVFGVFLATPTMLFTTEIVAPETRHLTIPLAVLTSWSLHFLLTLLLPMVMKAIGMFTFLIFAILCTALYVVADAICIETLAKSEEEIENYVNQIPRHDYSWNGVKGRLKLFKCLVTIPGGIKLEDKKNVNISMMAAAGKSRGIRERPQYITSQPWYGRGGIEHHSNLVNGAQICTTVSELTPQHSVQDNIFSVTPSNYFTLEGAAAAPLALNLDQNNVGNPANNNTDSKLNEITFRRWSTGAYQFLHLGSDFTTITHQSTRGNHNRSIDAIDNNDSHYASRTGSHRELAGDDSMADNNSLLYGRHLFLQFNGSPKRHV